MMSNEDYVKTNGQLCPACRGDDLEFTDPENHIGAFMESVACRCGFEFKRLFSLAGYEVEGQEGGMSILDFMQKFRGCTHFESLRVARRRQKEIGGELWSLCPDNKFRPGEVTGATGWAVTRP